MSFEENLKHANESLEKLNNQELALDESVKIYKEGLESIKKARLALEKARLEVEHIDE
ncbi:exodeoxyribonuclease VII small subunit [Campylobacter jejuni]|uniref:exodeoxyribonuclease VII small subunit n=1 Tax=Campylobacter coli TaxID=195 RepID=UPI00128A0FD8|nr:exodeoxyribonuclease VII small subunit [Campylobacter coli]EJC9045395.1 exodeoxyribonuclease VII small subunit [Campylobacter jejuni]EAI7874058.1 exodeoxyribonuclease VII small subunit [Campylobacter coli]EAJ1586043.1 exodeoxyribonuclease VII small subunit [Campylobacter coli]EAJ1626703.1 exodeoxyribonuclease VII small subunit [Campylobacter coli]EAK1304928.1 exodeoxyribonuclease VII small subunit [Campylobacter coli]